MTLSLAACGRTGLYSDRLPPEPLTSPDAGVPVDAGAVDAGVSDAGISEIDAGTITARVRIDADDFFKLWINGVLIDAPTELWFTPHTYEVRLSCRGNLIEIEGRNMWSQDGLDRGVVFDLTVGDQVLVSDSSWENAVDLGPHGMAPWGDILGQSSARWIWSWNPSVPASQKVADETVHFRRPFAPRCP